MSGNGFGMTIGDAMSSDVRKALDKPARRRLNVGLLGYIRQHLGELHALDQFRGEDVFRTLNVKARFPLADARACTSSLARLCVLGVIEKVGVGHTGVYRARGSAPNLEDDAVIENALKALGDLEALIRRYRDVLGIARNLKKALGGV